MLKTFPKRKMMFVPQVSPPRPACREPWLTYPSQAVCKTIVPDTFRVLLSQRRRWINSTVHNLAELVLVNDLCGTFCFSMRFVVFMELAGTLVLPAAIAFTFYVVAQAIIASIDPSKGPVPVIPLILLGVILGLPGLLIVVTSRKFVYVGWMGIYLLSLPIWNFVFPSYAFWHMDDFSWGATRIVQGDKGGDHSNAEGKFDASHITMKRWGEFERERRWKSGTHSRDSTFDVIHRSGSPERSGSTRYSVVSSDTYHSNANVQDAANNRLLGNAPGAYESDAGHSKTGSSSGGARARLDAVPLLELPAPLGPDAANKARGLPASGTPGSITVARPREPSPAASNQSHSHSSYASRPPYEAYPSPSAYHDDEARPMMASATSSPDPEASRPGMQHMMMGGSGATLAADLQQQIRHGSVSSEQQYPGVSEAQFSPGFSAEPEEDTPVARGPPVVSSQRPREPQGRLSRGFSLVDDGPVASSQGVRQVTRGARRQSTAGNHGPTSPGSVSGSSAAHAGGRERYSRPQ
jgi:chitin synthase